MTRIKICGLTRPEDIQAVNEARPDYCGFIIEFPKSRRSISRQKVTELVKDLSEEIIPVGVFVNAPVSLPSELYRTGVIRMIQLHGQEDEDYIKELKQQVAAPVIKAFSIQEEADMVRALRSGADYILLDQGAGGTGVTFDWSLVKKTDRPFFLAGGLGTDNLEEAIQRLAPFAVDLSSSLETEGKKDPEKIKETVRLVRTGSTIRGK